MKRPVMKIISIALATSLLTATAASAAPRNTGNYRAARVQTHNNNGNAVALGFGLFALGALAIIASQNNRYDNRYYAPPQPAQYGNGYYGQPAYSSYNYGPTTYGQPTDYNGSPYNGNYDGRYDSYGYGR